MRRAWLRVVGAVVVSGSALWSAPDAAAQAYPSKPIRLIVPFTPAGSTDIFARIVGQKLSESLKQQVVIENRPGAGGSIGAELAAKAPADGYTLLMGHIGTLAINPALYPKLPYDAVKSFTPVSLVVTVANVLVVHPALPVNNVAEFIAYARANPGRLNYGSGGNGSAAHIAVEYLKQRAGLDIVHVPYKGTGPAVTDLIAGQLSLTMTGVPPTLQYIQVGKLKALGVSSLKRIEALPNVPTIAESGLNDFDATQWYGVVAPAGTPRDIVLKLNAEIRAMLESREMKERMLAEGAIASPGTPEGFGALIKNEITRWGAVVQSAKIRAE